MQNPTLQELEVAEKEARRESRAAEGIYRTAQAEVASTTQLLREATIFLESAGATAAELEQHNRAEAKANLAKANLAKAQAELTAAQAKSRAASRAFASANQAADDALNFAIARYRAAFDASDRLMSEMMGGTPTPDIVSKHLDAERNTALAA
ncbi:MAG: hypothetical protein EBY16_09765, partial [Gammaproteobacteria bacterium]|nr:hypothetical protein [Gammaproteobacteria bacterium]